MPLCRRPCGWARPVRQRVDGPEGAIAVWQMLIATWVLALCLVWMTPHAHAATRTLSGQVSRVVDGDTLWFKPDDPAEPLVAVRLRGIDAPESCQAWGWQAAVALREQVQGRPATLRIHGQDDYRRTLGTLSVGHVDINGALVTQGHAWAWRDTHGRSPYLIQEAVARQGQHGLHADPAAESPWDFRQRHGRCRR
jgi:micrococcal nuclease